MPAERTGAYSRATMLMPEGMPLEDTVAGQDHRKGIVRDPCARIAVALLLFASVALCHGVALSRAAILVHLRLLK